MKRNILLTILILSAFFTGCKEDVQKQPNILFIAIDDLRPELNCYGATQIKSPNIDKIASESVVFDRAYCNVPVCGASRASLLTGILPAKTRFVDYRTQAEVDVPNAQTLPGVFRDGGYTCISNGKIFHHTNDKMDISWSEKPWSPGIGHAMSFDPGTMEVLSERGKGRFFEAPDVPDSVYFDYKVAQKTIRDLQQLKETGEPFFLGCGFIRPHLPFYAPKKYWDMYDPASIEVADNRFLPENAPKLLRGSGEFKSYAFGEYSIESEAFHKKMRHGYYACVSYVDHLVGMVMEELERLDLAENTIVVLWGDHGWHLGEHEFWGKHNTLHNALQIPLMVKVPGKANANTKALVESVDIYLTICDLAGLAVPEYVMGKSFTSVLDDPSKQFRDAVYARFKVADAIITDEFNYSLYKNGEEMLYNRVLDPDENINVAADVQYAEQLERMRKALSEKQNQAESYK